MTNAKYLSILNEIKNKGGDLDSDQPNDKVLIIDGLNTFIRCFTLYQLSTMMVLMLGE